MTERRFLYGIACIGENARHAFVPEPGMRTDWLTETDEKHLACDGMPLMYKY